MSEIKPVGEIKFSDYSGLYVRFNHKEPGIKVGAQLYTIPATHRIVPVENLRTLLGVAYIMRQHLRADSDAIRYMDELQSIIDKEPT